MAIKSTFSSAGYRIARAFIFISFMLLVFFTLVFTDLSPASIAMIIPISIFGWAWIFLFRGELRKKAVKVGIDGDKINVSRFFGVGKTITYDLSFFSGYITATVPSKNASYEYLYLMADEKAVIILSQFYHSNYDQLKFMLDGVVPFLGHKDFKELKKL